MALLKEGDDGRDRETSHLPNACATWAIGPHAAPRCFCS